MESAVNIFLSYSTNPLLVSEAVLDHDYTLQSMKRSGDSSRDMWNGLIATVKKMESLISEPIRTFIQDDLRNFKVSPGRPLKSCGSVPYPAIGVPPHPRPDPETVRLSTGEILVAIEVERAFIPKGGCVPTP